MKLPRASEGMALVGGPIVELLNYCTAVKFDSFEAAESKFCNILCSVHARTHTHTHTIRFVTGFVSVLYFTGIHGVCYIICRNFVIPKIL